MIMNDMQMREALKKYCTSISILKKGYEQEKYRIDQICRSFLGEKTARTVTSVDIATYRDGRLAVTNPHTKKTLATSTVRLEMSLLSNFFDIGRIEWGICDANPVANVRKPKAPPGRDRRLTPREDRIILRYAHQHVNADLYSIVVLAISQQNAQGVGAPKKLAEMVRCHRAAGNYDELTNFRFVGDIGLLERRATHLAGEKGINIDAKC